MVTLLKYCLFFLTKELSAKKKNKKKTFGKNNFSHYFGKVIKQNIFIKEIILN